VPGVLLIAVQHLAPGKQGRGRGLRQRKWPHAQLLWPSNMVWRHLRGCFRFTLRRQLAHPQLDGPDLDGAMN
jgi:hypothetical protein